MVHQRLPTSLIAVALAVFACAMLASSAPTNTASPSYHSNSAERQQAIRTFVQGAGHRVEDIDKVRALLAEHNQKTSGKREEQRKKQESGAEFKVLREKISAQEKARKAIKQQERVDPGQEIVKYNVEAGLDSYLLDGDMLLSVAQAERLASGQNMGPLPTDDNEGAMPAWWSEMGNRSEAGASYKGGKVIPKEVQQGEHKVEKRQAINPTTFPDSLWPFGFIPFTFDSSVSAATKTLIRKAVGYWNDYTCLYYYEDTTLSYSPRLLFTTTLSGCWSNIGRDPSVVNQTVSIQAGNCEFIGTIAHEAGHAAGFFHEHMRHDRDAWVLPVMKNVKNISGYPEQFDKQTPTTNSNFNLTYDFGSIMHYPKNAFANTTANGTPLQTLITMPFESTWEWDSTIGQRKEPSMTDYKALNALYNCPAQCASQPKTCNGGGFQNPNYCNLCVCPPGIGGDSCQTPLAAPIQLGYAPTGSPNTCTGANLTATTTWATLNGSIGSASWQGQDGIVYSWCHWYLVAPAGYHLQIEVLSLGGYCNAGCGYGNTEVRVGDNGDWSKTGRRLCCSTDLVAQGTSSLTFNSLSRDAMISLYVRQGVQSFSLRYKAVAN